MVVFSLIVSPMLWVVVVVCGVFDLGIPWTRTRKFLLVLNLVLFLVVSKESKYDETHVIINGVITFILTLAKLPEMQGVRVFGINK